MNIESLSKVQTHSYFVSLPYNIIRVSSFCPFVSLFFTPNNVHNRSDVYYSIRDMSTTASAAAAAVVVAITIFLYVHYMCNVYASIWFMYVQSCVCLDLYLSFYFFFVWFGFSIICHSIICVCWFSFHFGTGLTVFRLLMPMFLFWYTFAFIQCTFALRAPLHLHNCDNILCIRLFGIGITSQHTIRLDLFVFHSELPVCKHFGIIQLSHKKISDEFSCFFSLLVKRLTTFITSDTTFRLRCALHLLSMSPDLLYKQL